MPKFASRAWEKLQHAIDSFNLDLKGKVVADFGSSTGGFVDVLLRRGVEKIYSIDTAYGELAWELRNDKRVIIYERTNAMHINLPEKVDLISVDVSWTKQKHILPNVFKNLKKGGIVVSLVKPHYEADKKLLVKGKLLEEKIPEILDQVKSDISNSGGFVEDIVQSPILGEKGKNKEYLFLIKPS